MILYLPDMATAVTLGGMMQRIQAAYPAASEHSRLRLAEAIFRDLVDLRVLRLPGRRT